jgi:hypothetical protein
VKLAIVGILTASALLMHAVRKLRNGVGPKSWTGDLAQESEIFDAGMLPDVNWATRC